MGGNRVYTLIPIPIRTAAHIVVLCVSVFGPVVFQFEPGCVKSSNNLEYNYLPQFHLDISAHMARHRRQTDNDDMSHNFGWSFLLIWLGIVKELTQINIVHAISFGTICQ